MVHGGFETDARAERWLFEDACQHLAPGDRIVVAGLLKLLFEAVGDIQEMPERFRRRVGEGNEIKFVSHENPGLF